MQSRLSPLSRFLVMGKYSSSGWRTVTCSCRAFDLAFDEWLQPGQITITHATSETAVIFPDNP